MPGRVGNLMKKFARDMVQPIVVKQAISYKTLRKLAHAAAIHS